MTTMLEFERATRWRKFASTWIEKSRVMLTFVARDTDSEDVRSVVSYEASRLVGDMLDVCDGLAHLLDPNQLDEVERQAKEFASKVRRARLAIELAKTEGRTTEEAASFALKAAELRG